MSACISKTGDGSGQLHCTFPMIKNCFFSYTISSSSDHGVELSCCSELRLHWEGDPQNVEENVATWIYLHLYNLQKKRKHILHQIGKVRTNLRLKHIPFFWVRGVLCGWEPDMTSDEQNPRLLLVDRWGTAEERLHQLARPQPEFQGFHEGFLPGF